MRRRSKRWRPRKQFRGCSSLVELPVFTRKDRVRFPAAPYGVLTQLGSVPDSYSGSSGFDSLAPHLFSPRSSADLEHLATDQGVEGSNPSAEVWVASQMDKARGFYPRNFPGSSPGRPVGKFWAASSAGRALVLQTRCHRFDPCAAHFCPGRPVPRSPEWTGWVPAFLASAPPQRRFNSSPGLCADVARRSSSCLPSSRHGFDSHLPLIGRMVRTSV
jgi:hypothetical protein